MRLYLSSYRIGNKPDELLALAKGKKRTALILNAYDYKNETDRASSLEREMSELKGIGLEPTEVDLRKFFGKQPGELRAELQKYDIVYIRGGSGFVLRRAYFHSGADEVFKELLKDDVIVYAGYSAGPCMLGPTLKGIEGAVDLPDFIPNGYPDDPTIWDCLGILPYVIAPHYKSDHPETEEIDKTIEYYITNHMPFIALRDGEAIVVNDDKQYIVG